MHGIKRAVAAVLVAALVAVAAPAAVAEEGSTVRREDDCIVYLGGLAQDANARVRALLQAGGVRWLHISSGGGEVGLGMDPGELVRDHALDVRVEGVCASSCANHVFPAGRRKVMAADAVVIWHGSAMQADVGTAAAIDFDEAARLRGRPLGEAGKARLVEEFAAYGRRMRERQGAFYASLGVDERVTVFGQDVQCGCDWTVPVEDMARFGITGVEAGDGYGSGLASLPRPVAWLTLDDHPAYAATIDAARAAVGTAAQ